MTSINTFLWFDNDAAAAAELYTSVLPNARITGTTHNPDGSVLIIELDLAGHAVTLLNGGPIYQLSEAASLQVVVDGQDEVDRLWAALTADGGKPGPCGWLVDRFGLSWQVVPSALPQLMGGEHAAAVSAALRTMSKIDLQALQDAHDRG